MPKSACRIPGSSGFRTYVPKFARSSLGYVALNVSFMPIGMTTSLMSGLPRRETWYQPDAFCRHVEDHMLTTAFGSAVSVGAEPFAVRLPIGTERAIEWTL